MHPQARPRSPTVPAPRGEGSFWYCVRHKSKSGARPGVRKRGRGHDEPGPASQQKERAFLVGIDYPARRRAPGKSSESADSGVSSQARLARSSAAAKSGNGDSKTRKVSFSAEESLAE